MMAVTKPPREKERINVMATDMPTAVDVPMEAPHEAEKRKRAHGSYTVQIYLNSV